MPSTDIKDYYRRAWGIGDRQPQRRLKAAGPLLLAPYLLPYAAAFIGTAATGLMAQKQIQNYFENNPDAMPKFKEWVSGFGTLPGDQPKVEEELKELSKPVGLPDQTNWAGSFKDEGLTLPEPEKVEAPDNIPPQIKVETTGFPDLSEDLNKPIIFNFAKDKKEVKKKLDAIEPYGGATRIGASTKKDRTKDIEFLEAFELFKNTHFGGNESAASKAINQSREKIRALKNRTWGENRRTGKVSTQTEEILTTEVPENPIRYIDATTSVKKDQNYFKNFLTKENKNEFMSPQNIANVLNFKFKDKSERDNFTAMLRQLKVKQKEVPGKRYDAFKLSDVVTKLTEWNKRKLVKGDKLSQTKRLEIENRLDPELFNVRDKIKARVRKASKNEDIYLQGAIDDVGHAVSIKITDEFPKLFENSTVNRIGSLVYQDPYINRDVMKLTGYESKFHSMFKELDKLLNKPVTEETQAQILKIKGQMEINYNNLIETISTPKKLKAIMKKANKEITSSHLKKISKQTDRVAKIDVKVPEIGEKFLSENLFVDMSNVDPVWIMGNVDKINPQARYFKDLSEEQKDLYEANMAEQAATILETYYKKAKFPKEQVEELKETLTEKHAQGGLSGVDQYIINRGI